MRTPGRNSERGQSIVLLALAFVAMLGFAGLAIDGGLIFTERRHAQNAADAAALAGALAILNGGDPIAVGYARALDNEYNNDEAENWVDIYYPPVDGPFVGNTEYVQVNITSRLTTVLIHLVYSGANQTTVTAVARARPSFVAPLFNGDAIVGLSPDGCSVVWTHGDSTTKVVNSGVFVNSNDPNCAFKASGGNDFDVDGGINVVGGVTITGGASVSPAPTTGATPVTIPDIPVPSCGGSAARGAGTFSPGNTSDFKFTTGTWVLDPGIYCVDDGFSVAGGVTLTGNNVLIYVRSGAIAWNGGATIVLDAPDDGEYAGMLVYQDPANSDMAVINGNSDSDFTGTIFIPGADVQVTGTGSADGYHTQIIGWKVEFSGTSDTLIVYDEGENFKLREPPKVDLAQ